MAPHLLGYLGVLPAGSQRFFSVKPCQCALATEYATAVRHRTRRLLILIAVLSQLLTGGFAPVHAVTYPFEIESAGTLYPYVASLWYSDDGGDSWYRFCSGTLIKSDVVMTAAHCSRDISGKGYDIAAQVGSDDFGPNTDSPGWVSVSQLWWNPRYSTKSLANDLGLMLLDSPVDSSFAKPLSLPTSSQIAATKSITKFTILGWGIDQNGDSPGVLQGANILDQAAVAKKIWKTSFNPLTMIAAGAYNKKEKVYSGGCSGDSGGPLVATLKNAKVLMGVTSWGSSNCNSARPTIFTRVSYYLNDIKAGEKRLRNLAAAALPPPPDTSEPDNFLISQNISFQAIPNKVYGTYLFSPSVTSDSDLQVTLETTTPTVCTVVDEYVNIIKVGSCSLTASQPGDADYAAAIPVTQKFSITPANLTVTASSPSVPYWITKPTVTPVYSGFVNSEKESSTNFTIGLIPPACLISAPLSSQNKKVKTNCSGGSATNYTFTYVNGTATIASLSDVVYGSTPFSLSAGSTSALTVTFASPTPTICSVVKTTVTLLKVGTCSITATQIGDSKSSVTESFKVTPATLVVTASSPSVIFGGSKPLVSASYSGFVNGDKETSASFKDGLVEPTCSTSYTILSEADSEPTTSCSGGSAANYTFSFVDGVVNIEKASQTITFGSLVNQVYGSASFIIAATSSAQVPVSFSSTTPAVCSVSNTTVSVLKVGKCTIAADQAGDASYAPATAITQSFTVTPAVLTVTASSPTVTYGSTKPAITPVYSKFLNGDTQSSETFKTGLIAPTCGTSYTPLSPVGTSPITLCSGGSSANYTFIFVDSTVTITKASQAITFNPPSTKTYGASNVALTASSNSNLAISFSSLSPKTCSVESGKVSILAAGLCELSASQSGDSNFNAAISVTASFTIEKAQLTVSASSGKVNFGASTILVLPTYSGFVNGDTSDSTSFADQLVPPLCKADLSVVIAVGESYSSVCAGGTSANYEFSNFVNGSYQVLATPPGAPTIGAARALNSTSATITYFAPAFKGGAVITKYTATSSPGGLTGFALQPSSGTITVTGLKAGISYKFTVTAQNSAGVSIASEISNSIDTTYYVGGTGPGGGLIFWDAGSSLAWGRYLEVAPKTWYGGNGDPVLRWSRNATTSISTGSVLGSGSTNTDAMVELDSAPGYAATAVRAYAGTGGTTLGQWFVPSKDELNLLCSFFTGQPQDPYRNYYDRCKGDAWAVGPTAYQLINGYYLSSSQDPTNNYVIMMNSSDYRRWELGTKDNAQYVKAIRAFGSDETQATPPGAPTIGAARALNSTSATITYFAPAFKGGAVITKYTATSSPGGLTGFALQPSSGTITVTGLKAGISYKFTVTAQNSAGVSIASEISNSIDTTYYVGGTGPGGGLIFWDAGSSLAWGRYLEVAPKTWYGGNGDPVLRWSRNATTSISTGSVLGSGSTNTDAMVELDSAPGYAATAVRAYAGTGGTTLGQWFVPSKDELNLLCSFFTGQPQDPYRNYYDRCKGDAWAVGPTAYQLINGYYLSSSQDPTNNYVIMMNSSDYRRWELGTKDNAQYVKAIRAFGS